MAALSSDACAVCKRELKDTDFVVAVKCGIKRNIVENKVHAPTLAQEFKQNSMTSAIVSAIGTKEVFWHVSCVPTQTILALGGEDSFKKMKRKYRICRGTGSIRDPPTRIERLDG